MESTNLTRIDLEDSEEVRQKTNQLIKDSFVTEDDVKEAYKKLAEFGSSLQCNSTNLSGEKINSNEEENTIKIEKESTSKNQISRLSKYYVKRYRLFYKFDEGIMLDEESWFSVTPEKLAKHIAQRTACNWIVDPFCGAGGNIIQFAFICDHVTAIDIDPYKIECAKNNARIYGVEKKIDFILGNAFTILPLLSGIVDAVFLSPPWGGPEYIKKPVYDIEKMGQFNGLEILDMARSVTPNVIFLLPKTIDPNQLLTHCGAGSFEIEQNFLNAELETVTAYFGTLKLK
jgi:trimethylguanosine synthase